jgi:hypothetical protein
MLRPEVRALNCYRPCGRLWSLRLGLAKTHPQRKYHALSGITAPFAFSPVSDCRRGRPHGGNLMEEGMGSPGGAVEQIFGPHLTAALLIQRHERCIVYRFPPAPTRRTPPHFRFYGVPIPTPLAGLPSHLCSTAAPSPSAPNENFAGAVTTLFRYSPSEPRKAARSPTGVSQLDCVS